MTALEDLRQRADKARDHPGVTCAASRHVQIVAEALARGEAMDEQEQCAESMLAVVAALWEARRSLELAQADVRARCAATVREAYSTHGLCCADSEALADLVAGLDGFNVPMSRSAK
jgi:hypothetical protein